jgi:hypothetical protein
LYVKVDGQYVGAILKDGTVRGLGPDLVLHLELIGKDPAAAARR